MLKWWQRAVFYQVYPRSFADGNGDGIGDLHGLIDKLDYIQSLGAEGLWLSPHFPSPQLDCGYDVSDYTDVNTEYGTLVTFQTLLDEAHKRNIRIVLDLVLNHTSDQHRWFQESQKSRDNDYADWYVWHDPHPETGGPPNNWMATFGGSAWEYVEARGQYYYHYFFKEQPDLNWRNPAVKTAIFNAARFWLNMGVDGFRLDAISTMFEDPALTDHRANVSQAELHLRAREADSIVAHEALNKQWQLMFEHQNNQPGVHELFQEMRLMIDEYEDRVLIGEATEAAFYGDGDNELHLAFNFPLMLTDRLTPAWIRKNQKERFAELPATAWPCNTLNNHDTPRVHSRYGDGLNDDELARLSLVLMLTLKGTPFLYNGEEIGMRDHMGITREAFRDGLAVWRYNLERQLFLSEDVEALRMANQFGRDKCRTPHHWANAPHGGFSPAEVAPWLPVHPNYANGVNVADQEDDPASMLNFYRKLIHLRQASPALMEGEQEFLHDDNEDYLALLRRSESQTYLVILNFSDTAQTTAFDLAGSLKTIYTSHDTTDTPDAASLTLAPFGILIAEVVA